METLLQPRHLKPLDRAESGLGKQVRLFYRVRWKSGGGCPLSLELGDSDDGQEELRKAPSGVVWEKDEKNFIG